MGVKVVADSHALVRYLVDPQRLSEPALEAPLTAEDSGGVVVSVATLGDLWYASRKTSSPPVARVSSSSSAKQFSTHRRTWCFTPSRWTP